MNNLKLTVDTPLSALIRKSHHEEFITVIESFRPYMVGGDASVEALELLYLGIDFTHMPVGRVYRSLAMLINHDALIPPITILARYLVSHSNLGTNANSIYRQIMRYCKLYR